MRSWFSPIKNVLLHSDASRIATKKLGEKGLLFVLFVVFQQGL
jgi:hypothetical protein